jgi:hypothetical protein
MQYASKVSHILYIESNFRLQPTDFTFLCVKKRMTTLTGLVQCTSMINNNRNKGTYITVISDNSLTIIANHNNTDHSNCKTQKFKTTIDVDTDLCGGFKSDNDITVLLKRQNK